MKLRQFLSILGVVALVAVIYSPSTIGFSASPGGDGATSPTDTSSSGTSMFLSYLHQSGYHVTVANDSQQVMASLSGQQKVVYVLIGADLAMTSQEVTAVESGFNGGRVSALVSEGNTTNSAILDAFGVKTTGAPIVDPTSSFQDNRVFTVRLTLVGVSSFGAATGPVGVIDIASPLVINSSSSLRPAAQSSASSFDDQSGRVGPRTVVAAGASPSGARALLISDSAPFTNFLFNYTQPSSGVNEKSFVAAMVSYVDPTRNATIVFDNSHYAAAKPPKFQVGLPIGPLVAYGLEQSLSGLNSYYASFPSQVSGFLGGFGISVSPGVASAVVALILLISVYGAVTRWFAPEKKGKDDQPLPNVERTIVAQSSARVDFLQTSRSKEGYIAALSQLYEVLDSIVAGEFGARISKVEEGALAQRVGADEARRAKKLFFSLSKIHDYATGEKRFLFPPVFRWRALTTRMAAEAEAFLNPLGITIAGEDALSAQRTRQAPGDKVRA